jgi:hypothetical protein
MKKLPWVWIDHRIDVPVWIVKYIGRIAVEWSDLEWQMEDMIRLLMGTLLRNGRISTTGMNMRSRVMVATNFVQAQVYHNELDPAFLTRTIKIGKSITEKLEGERNKVVHGLWGKYDGQWCILRNSGTRSTPELREIKKLARAVLPQRENVTPEKLDSLLMRIRIAREDMIQLCTDLEGVLPPSPNKSPRRIPQHRPNPARRKKASARLHQSSQA